MKADEQLKCKDCDWYGSCEYYDRRKETPQICKMFNNTLKFVAELEKIKEEIKKIRMSGYFISSDGQSGGYYERKATDYKSDVFEIIDNHIKELKEDNNGNLTKNQMPYTTLDQHGNYYERN